MTDGQDQSAEPQEPQGPERGGPATIMNKAASGIQGVFLAFVWFTVALVGTGFLGSFIMAIIPGLIMPIAIGIGLVAVITLVRPMEAGFLRRRSTTFGMLMGALIMTALPEDEPGDGVAPDTEESSATAPEVEPAQEKKAEKPKPKPFSNPVDQRLWINMSKNAIRERLRDPSSAQFRNVVFHAYQGTTAIVCGEVNGKNAFGGYSGYEKFVASASTFAYLQSDMTASEFSKTWNELCLK